MEGMIGEIRLFAPNFAPKAWAYCQGQILSIASNTALFSILGTTYGGNGTTTFALPNFNGRSAVSSGRGPGLSDYRLGQKTGTETVTLNITQMPAHTHTVLVTNPSGSVTMGGFNDEPNQASPVNGYPALVDGFTLYDTRADEFMQMSNVNVGGAINAALDGGNQSHENRQPFIAINYIICQYGIFPSRN
ncbi:MAG: tail fiber protein [Chitinophagaceae bacterium]|nr:tail fiber protein [Chitinophagaceae bacterium]MCB9044617.1 tail fiber protein [Chitinophagales bacterium]